MREFRFRFQKVLDYRLMLEESAKEAYRLAREASLAAENQFQEMKKKLADALKTPGETIEEMMIWETYIERLEDELEEQIVLMEIRKKEEASAFENWREARKSRKSLQKLHDMAKENWEKEVEKREQKQLDEWTVLKREAK